MLKYMLYRYLEMVCMYNEIDENRRKIQHEDRIEVYTIRHLIKAENEKLLNESQEEEIAKSLKKIYFLYKKLEQAFDNGEVLKESEKQNFNFVVGKIEEISAPIRDEINLLFEQFENVSNKNRATEILFELNKKYEELKIKGITNSHDDKDFKFVQKSIDKILIEEEQEKNNEHVEEYDDELEL